MRLLARLGLGILAISAILATYDVVSRIRQSNDELERRTASEAAGLEPVLKPLVDQQLRAQAATFVEAFAGRAQASGLAVVDRQRNVIAATRNLTGTLREHALAIEQSAGGQRADSYFKSNGTLFYASAVPLDDSGAFVIVHRALSLAGDGVALWGAALVRLAIPLTLLVGVTVLLVRASVTAPIARTASWLREIRLGRVAEVPAGEESLVSPILREMTPLLRSLSSAREAAAVEARLREASESVWTAERLRVHVKSRLHDSEVFVVSNREPYMHRATRSGTEVIVPASGLVTALEPVLRACQGTWIAHGSGDRDRETVDAFDRLRVPPEQPEYALRRVWLTLEEEHGYYDGFANEGLWPLCHIAHTRPLFRAPDFAHYRTANERFAQAVLEESIGAAHPVILIQDYHFALLPRLIKEARPDARVAMFWHIPWPNPESFAICPWQSELVDGLLGADVVAFHTQAHCNNFLETVDQAVESQIEWQHFTARRRDHTTQVRAVPISVAWRDVPPGAERSADAATQDRLLTLRRLGVRAPFLGIGVDRLDYTKGLVERFRGLERALERWPALVGTFTFVQIAAPSRSTIPRYQQLAVEVENEVRRINERFQRRDWQPIVLLKRHHDHREIEAYYRAADVCLVTSLHDGMNLVAKEFVASRSDEDGVLILSRFAGASHELRDALIVNPYDAEQVADAIHQAFVMEATERQARMRRLRRCVREHNVYRWAATLVTDLADLHVEHKPPAARHSHEV